MPLELLMILGTAVAAVPAAYVARWGTRGMPDVGRRTLDRLLIVTPLAILSGIGMPVLVFLARTLADEGR